MVKQSTHNRQSAGSIPARGTISKNLRVLCFGNNTEDTDRKVTDLAAQHDMHSHGLLSELVAPIAPQQHQLPGWYHTSVYDAEFGRLVDLANQFDLVIMLDQPRSAWSHPDAFLNTIRVMQAVVVPVCYQNPEAVAHHDRFSQLVTSNPSFCIFPWIELLVNHDYTTVCCRSDRAVTPLRDLRDFATDSNYQSIRQRMLRGERVPEHCSTCYRYEDLGITSARQQETVEWANRLALRELEDLDRITRPVYYEVRASNRCNLQCRMCEPGSSHLIEREYRELGLIDSGTDHSQRLSTGFEIVDLESVQKLYIAGGEPTVQTEFYEFLDRCIQQDRTAFEILVNTNGTKLSQRFLAQLGHFDNFQFVFSVDGFESVNHYIRWPSDWHTIIQNWSLLRQRGHQVTVNTTVSIYNVANLHRLYDYIDLNFPGTLVHAQLVEHPSHLSPFLFPDRRLAVQGLDRIAQTQCYRNDQLFASTIDGIRSRLATDTDVHQDSLADFWRFNDVLDRSRNIQLGQFIPELEQHRPSGTKKHFQIVST